jgi:phospholipase C
MHYTHREFLGILSVVAAASACGSASQNRGTDAGTDARTSGDARPRDAAKDGHVRVNPDSAPPDAGDAGDAAINPASWDQSYPRPTDQAAAAGRLACQYTRGDLPAQTLGPGTLLDKDIPIEHVVVLIQENHSFDNYLGHLAAYEATNNIVPAPDGHIESAPDTATNPDIPESMLDGGPTTGSHPYEHAGQLCELDTNHDWGGSHVDWDHGLADGFYFVNNNGGMPGLDASLASGERAMWWYDERDIPFHYSLYSTFAIADHYHSAVLGPTWPNRMYAYSATSLGVTTNVWPDITAFPYPAEPVIVFDELEERAVSWNLYTEGAPGAGVVLGISLGTRYAKDPTLSVTTFLAQAKAGTLPAVSFVDGNNLNEGPQGDDEHPPGEIEIGQHFVWEIVNAVTTSPLWKSTVLFVTYDEGGGLYDHVSPPDACLPDNLPPVLTNPADESVGGTFGQYGFRVPFVAVSPYSKKSYVSHTVYSHASLTRFIEAKWKLPALTGRDANADPFTDVFDWQSPPFLTPPVFPEPMINAAAVTLCTEEFSDAG